MCSYYFFYLYDRLVYLKKIIENINTYQFITDIYIHTNAELDIDSIFKYDNGVIKIIIPDSVY